ncbi:MAG: hypothetical protein ACOYIP_01535 [Coriobacteriales bacterium]
MRKFILAFVVASVLALCSFGIAGCGGGGGNGSDQADFTGVWDVESMTGVSDEDMQMVQSLGGVQATLAEDGTFALSMMGMVMPGTWEFADGKANVTVEGETLPATIEGGKLKFAQDGTEMLFTKSSDQAATAPTESQVDYGSLLEDASAGEAASADAA